MSKMLRYMVVDTETATLPLCAEIARNAEEKKKLAIAKPLVYDIGWTITNRKGELLDTKQFLVAETFSVPAIFNTAYYAEKRPRYLKMLADGETMVLPWNEIMKIFIADLHTVDAVGAFNSMFDFKKAIPFTELYISKLYSPDYYAWENMQRNFCQKILNEKYTKNPEKEFETEIFRFRGEEFKLFDLWGLATAHLLNNASYKNECVNHGRFTASGVYFKTSAETSYQYLCNKYDFIESHTALDDAIIETFILSKVAARHAINPGISFFPFRELGETVDFAMRRKNPNQDECLAIYNAIAAYITAKQNAGQITNYLTGLINKLHKLTEYANIECPF